MFYLVLVQNLGLLEHVGMLSFTLTLPKEVMLATLENIATPVLLIYPAATWLICLLFLDQESHISAEENVHRDETFLQQIVENIPDMIFVKEAENLKFVRFNKAGEDLLGYSREDLLGKNDYDFFSLSQAAFFTAKDREVLKNGKLVEIPQEEIDTRFKCKRILHTKKIPIVNSEGKAQFLLGISEDITERKKIEIDLSLADDEDDIRDLGATLLKRFGYDVITADNGKEALEIYQRKGESISLVILEIIMPVMDGRQCLTEILRINPTAKVIIASGYSESGSTRDAMSVGAKGFVLKPYNMRQLLTTICEILDKN